MTTILVYLIGVGIGMETTPYTGTLSLKRRLVYAWLWPLTVIGASLLIICNAEATRD